MTLQDQFTDAQREALVAEARRGLTASQVPAHLHEGLLRYVQDGILPGSFLQAVLCNDLREAVSRADPFAFVGLPALITFLEYHAPIPAWGSRRRVLAWTTTPDRLEV
jgi:hypothetical protein